MYSVFLSSYTNTRESLGELEKVVETLVLPNFHSRLYDSKETVHVFYFVIIGVASPFFGRGGSHTKRRVVLFVLFSSKKSRFGTSWGVEPQKVHQCELALVLLRGEKKSQATPTKQFVHLDFL